MKKIGLFALVLSILLLTVSCAKKQVVEDEGYNRTGSMQERENAFRNKVFAPYAGEGRAYATYAMAELVKDADTEGYYTVKFTNGPSKGKTIKTRDVILKTEPIIEDEVVRGMVVLRDFYNKAPGKSPYDRWNKAVISDGKVKDGRVNLEFPVDSNDFMATRETVNLHSLRQVTNPPLKDPRTWLP